MPNQKCHKRGRSVFKKKQNRVSWMYYGFYIYLCCKTRPCVSSWTWFTARAVIKLVSTDGRGSACVFLIRNVCICLRLFDSSFNCSGPDMCLPRNGASKVYHYSILCSLWFLSVGMDAIITIWSEMGGYTEVL